MTIEMPFKLIFRLLSHEFTTTNVKGFTGVKPLKEG